jgi:sorbitol/mannitol transport system substrate-binding protein
MERKKMSRTITPWRLGVVACAVAASASLAGCGAGATGGNNANSINVAVVGNPQMLDLKKLTKDNFTKETGITVNYTVLPETNTLDKITQDIATQAGQYDVMNALINQIPTFADNGWLQDLGTSAAADKAFDYSDILPQHLDSLKGKDGKVYGIPFTGESSFLMYRKDVMDAKGITVPLHPTWNQVADIAAKADGAQSGMKGICLRGLAGWSEVLGPLTTVVNTFGGTWFTKDWQAQLDSPEFTAATKFYVDLLQKHGEVGAAQSGFTECLTAMEQSKTAMWYDSTAAAGLLEDPSSSPVAGKIGFAYAPVNKTKASGWLSNWDWVVPKTTKKSAAAEKFIHWASGKDYQLLVGSKLGWNRVPAGTRASTYAIPQFKDVSAAYGELQLKSLESANPTNPGLQPRPTVGTWYVGIPEFPDLGDKVAQQISAAIAGRQSVETALANSQKLAEPIAKKYQAK